MLAVTEINSFEDLSLLRATWQELWQATPGASFIQSWEWMRSYWRHHGPGQRLRVLMMTSNGTPVAIVPFVVRKVMTRLGRAGVLTWPADESGAFFGPIGADPAAAMNAALRHVRSRRRDWNVVELSHVDEFGTDGGLSTEVLRSNGLKARQTAFTQHPVVLLEGHWDAYLESRPLSVRLELAQSERFLEQCGPLSFQRWRPAGATCGQTRRGWELFDVFEDIKRGSTAPSRKCDGDLALLKDVHPSAVDAGVVDIATLSLSGQPVACCYSYRSKRNVEVLFAGASRHEDAVQKVMLSYFIRDSFMRGDQRLLFHPEYSRLVRDWSDSCCTAVTCSHFARLSPSAMALRFSHQKRPAEPRRAPAAR